MKTLLIGSLAIVLATPVLGGTVPAANAPAEKFGSRVQLNFTHGGMGHGGFMHGGGFHGHGAFFHGHGFGHYPYYGFGYPYYYGYPYAAAFAFGVGLPLAYYGGYYAGAYAAPPYYYGYAPTAYYGGVRMSSSSRGSSGSSSSGGSLVSNVQSSLKNRGFYAGGVDGNFGPESQHALVAFQTSNGLPPTGTLDTPSLHALGVGVKSSKLKTTAQANTRPTAPAPRTPTTEETFVPPPIGAPATAPGIPTENTAAPVEPPPISPVPPAPPTQ